MTAKGPVIVGFDGSTCSRAALETAITLAQVSQAELVVAFVRRVELSACIGLPPVMLLGVQDDMECEVFMVAATRLHDEGLRWRFVVGSGDPCRELARFANGCGAGVVVVGTRGRGWRATLHRLLAGSVSRRLAQQRPVLVVS